MDGKPTDFIQLDLRTLRRHRRAIVFENGRRGSPHGHPNHRHPPRPPTAIPPPPPPPAAEPMAGEFLTLFPFGIVDINQTSPDVQGGQPLDQHAVLHSDLHSPSSGTQSAASSGTQSTTSSGTQSAANAGNQSAAQQWSQEAILQASQQPGSQFDSHATSRTKQQAGTHESQHTGTQGVQTNSTVANDANVIQKYLLDLFDAWNRNVGTHPAKPTVKHGEPSVSSETWWSGFDMQQFGNSQPATNTGPAVPPQTSTQDIHPQQMISIGDLMHQSSAQGGMPHQSTLDGNQLHKINSQNGHIHRTNTQGDPLHKEHIQSAQTYQESSKSGQFQQETLQGAQLHKKTSKSSQSPPTTARNDQLHQKSSQIIQSNVKSSQGDMLLLANSQGGQLHQMDPLLLPEFQFLPVGTQAGQMDAIHTVHTDMKTNVAADILHGAQPKASPAVKPIVTPSVKSTAHSGGQSNVGNGGQAANHQSVGSGTLSGKTPAQGTGSSVVTIDKNLLFKEFFAKFQRRIDELITGAEKIVLAAGRVQATTIPPQLATPPPKVILTTVPPTVSPTTPLSPANPAGGKAAGKKKRRGKGKGKGKGKAKKAPPRPQEKPTIQEPNPNNPRGIDLDALADLNEARLLEGLPPLHHTQVDHNLNLLPTTTTMPMFDPYYDHGHGSYGFGGGPAMDHHSVGLDPGHEGSIQSTIHDTHIAAHIQAGPLSPADHKHLHRILRIKEHQHTQSQRNRKLRRQQMERRRQQRLYMQRQRNIHQQLLEQFQQNPESTLGMAMFDPTLGASLGHAMGNNLGGMLPGAAELL